MTFAAKAAGGAGEKADRADHAAVAGATTTESHTTDADTAERRQEEGVFVAPAAGVATAAAHTAVATSSATIRRSSGYGNAADDACTRIR